MNSKDQSGMPAASVANPEDGKQRQIAGMFDRIAPTYDRLNHLLSFGTDRRWRRKLCKSLAGAKTVLDLACGTGDQLLEELERVDSVSFGVGADLSKEMLVHADQKLAGDAQVLQADATFLPFQSDSFDAVTISFGIRNVVQFEKGLAEMCRVLKPGGKCLVLEFGLPRNILIKPGYLFYFRYVLPVVGGWISGDRAAYKYLNQTVESFPYGSEFQEKMKGAGFSKVTATPLSFGIAYLYLGIK